MAAAGVLLHNFRCPFPRRVESLILSNSFCDTSYYYNSIGGGFMPVTAISWMPLSVLKGMILKDIELGLQAANDDAIREAIDLLLDQIDAIVNQKYLRPELL